MGATAAGIHSLIFDLDFLEPSPLRSNPFGKQEKSRFDFPFPNPWIIVEASH